MIVPCPYTENFATFSQDGKHRFLLFRRWDDRPGATVIGLNPSTANGDRDDPTIGTIKRILNFNGYGYFFMVNLFTMITPYPKELIHDNNFEKSIELWRESAFNSNEVIFAWGNFKTLGRNEIAKKLFPKALCFNHLKNGEPRHPMYLKDQTCLQTYF
jgi:hypothetical protein